MQGVCVRCGGEDIHEGTMLCEKCYAQSVSALEKARQTVKANKERKRAEREAIEAEKERKLKAAFRPRTLWEKRESNRGE